MNHQTDSRRYDIDWLRVLAFILLIFYHIGQFYVADWGWHVKSAYQSEFLQNIMMLVNQWRMPLIFVISGVALSLVEPKISNWSLLKTRFVRIWIPLVIGMYLIVPPQLYYQLIQNDGFTGSYLSFFSIYTDASTKLFPQYHYSDFGLLTWNHLWYLAYLWHYTLVYLLLKPLLTRINWQSLVGKAPAVLLFLVPVGLFMLYGFFLKPYFPKTHALVGDWYNHAFYFTAFLSGYVLAKSANAWQKIIDNRKIWFSMAIIFYALLMEHEHGLLGNWLRAQGADVDAIDSLLVTRIYFQFVVYANVVCWLFTVIAYAGKYLNHKSAVLSYMNEAILPWYILHQTVIIVVAMTLANYSLGPVGEPLLVTLLTFSVCAIGYELIKRTNITRFIFGMKIKKVESSEVQAKLVEVN